MFAFSLINIVNRKKTKPPNDTSCANANTTLPFRHLLARCEYIIKNALEFFARNGGIGDTQ